MRFIQLLVEGVPGTKGALDYDFDPGLTRWPQKGFLRLEAFPELLATLLYPLHKENEPLGPGKAQRASIRFEAGDETYLLVRDYVKRKTHLSRLEPGGEDSFREISSEARFITETLNRSVKLPPQKIFRKLIISCPAKLDSAAPVGVSVDFIADKDEGAQLSAFKSERENIQRVREMEDRVDELQIHLFKIEDQLKSLIAPREELARIQFEYEKYQVLDREGLVTPQILAKLKAYPAAVERRALEHKEFEDRARDLTALLESLPVRPMWKEPLFMASAGVAFGDCIVASIFRDPLSLWSGLFAASAISAGVSYLQAHRRLEKMSSLKKEIKGLDAEKAGIEKRFEIETGSVRKFCEVANEKDTDEILHMVKRWEELKKELNLAKENLKEMEDRISEVALKEERKEIQTNIAQLQQKLAGIPAVSVDPNALDLKIQELEMKLGTKDVVSATASPAGGQQDSINTLIELSAEVLGQSVAQILQRSQKALDANVASLTGRTYTGFVYAPQKVTQFRQSDGSLVSWIGLPDEIRQILQFSVQFTLWQLLLSSRPFPLILDLISQRPSERLMKITLAGAHHVAKKAQVVVLAP